MLVLQILIDGFAISALYALGATGFTLIFGVHHILNLAHGAVFMWGAFVGLYAVTLLHAPFIVALLVACILAGLLSVALDWIAFRPLRRRGAPEFSAIITSIGAGLILMNSSMRRPSQKTGPTTEPRPEPRPVAAREVVKS